MYYSKLNARGVAAAKLLAERAGLNGSVGVELTPYGERCAYFRLSKKAVGDKEVAEQSAKLRAAGFDPDVLFMGCPVGLWGGFAGKAFSDMATALEKTQ